jgi:hypothetical protein|tara:strand:- start:474 stop:860 length:387 start_codon:yes stop_codon:yes gene_type:complete
MKISKQKLMEIISEECGLVQMMPQGMMGDDIDEEGRMAKRQLSDIAKYSQELMEMLQDETQLEAWVQSKLTKAADYIKTVKHYVEYGMEEGAYDQVMPEISPEMPQMDQEPMSYEYDLMEFDDDGGKI